MSILVANPGELRAAPLTQTVGEDVCPGIKRGGWAHLVTRTVPLTCPGDGILPHVEIDVSLMDAGHKLVMLVSPLHLLHSLAHAGGRAPPHVHPRPLALRKQRVYEFRVLREQRAV